MVKKVYFMGITTFRLLYKAIRDQIKCLLLKPIYGGGGGGGIRACPLKKKSFFFAVLPIGGTTILLPGDTESLDMC